MGSSVSRGVSKGECVSPQPVRQNSRHSLSRVVTLGKEFDPRSPSAGIDRTPLQIAGRGSLVKTDSAMDVSGMRSGVEPMEQAVTPLVGRAEATPRMRDVRAMLIDPRSPTVGIQRTPIQVNAAMTSTPTADEKVKDIKLRNKGQPVDLQDPRSPSENIIRTPVQHLKLSNDEDDDDACNDDEGSYIETLPQFNADCITDTDTDSAAAAAAVWSLVAHQAAHISLSSDLALDSERAAAAATAADCNADKSCPHTETAVVSISEVVCAVSGGATSARSTADDTTAAVCEDTAAGTTAAVNETTAECTATVIESAAACTAAAVSEMAATISSTASPATANPATASPAPATASPATASPAPATASPATAVLAAARKPTADILTSHSAVVSASTLLTSQPRPDRKDLSHRSVSLRDGRKKPSSIDLLPVRGSTSSTSVTSRSVAPAVLTARTAGSGSPLSVLTARTAVSGSPLSVYNENTPRRRVQRMQAQRAELLKGEVGEGRGAKGWGVDGNQMGGEIMRDNRLSPVCRTNDDKENM